MDNMILVIGCVVFLIGLICFAIGRGVFQTRAFFNKKAWNGPTKPLLGIGLLFCAIGLVLIILNMPK